MRGFRIICIVGIAFSIISVVHTVKTFRERKAVDLSFGSRFHYRISPIVLLIDEFVSLALELYVFVCINSLYLNDKEGRPRFGVQVPIYRISQPQSVETDLHSTQSAPSYKAVPDECLDEVVIQMQPEPSQSGTSQAD